MLTEVASINKSDVPTKFPDFLKIATSAPDESCSLVRVNSEAKPIKSDEPANFTSRKLFAGILTFNSYSFPGS